LLGEYRISDGKPHKKRFFDLAILREIDVDALNCGVPHALASTLLLSAVIRLVQLRCRSNCCTAVTLPGLGFVVCQVERTRASLELEKAPTAPSSPEIKMEAACR